MNDVRTIQEIIATSITARYSDSQELVVDFNWDGETAPLIVLDKTKGEWHLQTAHHSQDGAWRLCYVYHGSKMQWCIMVETCNGSIELANSRYLNQASAMDEAAALNRVGCTHCVTDRFRVQELA